MGFSLGEIAQLLSCREMSQKARPEVRNLAKKKLADIESRLQELQTLQDELPLLVNLCACNKNGCPIIEGLDGDT